MIVNNSSVAMYEQIAEILKEEIRLKVYKAGESIGTHERLAKRFNVSIITIRKAIELLSKEQLLTIRQGKGTFVNNPLRFGEGNKLIALSSLIKKNNLKEEIHVPTMAAISTPKHLPQNIKDAYGEKCVYINRLHSVNGVCISDYNIYLPFEFTSKFTKEEVVESSTYHLIQNKLEIALGRGVQVIRAEGANKEVARLLSLEFGSPVLVMLRDSYSKDGKLIEYIEAYCAPEYFSFQVELDLSVD